MPNACRCTQSTTFSETFLPHHTWVINKPNVIYLSLFFDAVPLLMYLQERLHHRLELCLIGGCVRQVVGCCCASKLKEEVATMIESITIFTKG